MKVIMTRLEFLLASLVWLGLRKKPENAKVNPRFWAQYEDGWRERAVAAEKALKELTEEDEAAEILADKEFADALRESIKQADAGKTRSWEEIKDEFGKGT